ncbi:MAG: hypothetical protein V7459_16285 [Oceanicoccus sp.]
MLDKIFREMNHSVYGLAAIICLLAASPAHSLGLGRIEASSYLGQPLRAQIDVIMETEDYGPDNVRVRQLGESEASDLGIDLIGFNSGYRFQTRTQSNRLVIDVTSRDSINEPFLNILIELRWPTGTVYREYTLLLDPVSSVASNAPDNSKKPASKAEQKRAAMISPAPSNLRPGGGSYQVRSGDNLSRIAGKVIQGTDISRNDMMQWLLQNNPRAFIGGKMDRLLAGAKLTLPADSNISLSTNTDAQSPVVRASNTATAAKNSSSSTTDRLSIVTPNTGSSGVAGNNTPDEVLASLQNQLVETTEVIESLRRENQVMRERLKQLEESDYVASLEQLVALKEREVSVLHQQLQQKNRLSEPGEPIARNENEEKVGSESTELNSNDSSGIGQQWWLILLLLLSLLGTAFFFMRWRSQSNTTKDASAGKAADDEMLQQLDSISGTEKYFDTVAADVSSDRYDSAPNLAVTRSRRDDATVKRSIVEKTRSYHPPEQNVLSSSEHDEIDDLISRAITMANRGGQAQAEALISAERTQQARIPTGDSGDIDARLEAALHYIEQLDREK